MTLSSGNVTKNKQLKLNGWIKNFLVCPHWQLIWFVSYTVKGAFKTYFCPVLKNILHLPDNFWTKIFFNFSKIEKKGVNLQTTKTDHESI